MLVDLDLIERRQLAGGRAAIVVAAIERLREVVHGDADPIVDRAGELGAVGLLHRGV
jgi:hypothetical protein